MIRFPPSGEEGTELFDGPAPRARTGGRHGPGSVVCNWGQDPLNLRRQQCFPNYRDIRCEPFAGAIARPDLRSVPCFRLIVRFQSGARQIGA